MSENDEHNGGGGDAAPQAFPDYVDFNSFFDGHESDEEDEY